MQCAVPSPLPPPSSPLRRTVLISKFKYFINSLVIPLPRKLPGGPRGNRACGRVQSHPAACKQKKSEGHVAKEGDLCSPLLSCTLPPTHSTSYPAPLVPATLFSPRGGKTESREEACSRNAHDSSFNWLRTVYIYIYGGVKYEHVFPLRSIVIASSIRGLSVYSGPFRHFFFLFYIYMIFSRYLQNNYLLGACYISL